MSELWSSVAVLVLPGCFVSFNDYPLGDVDGGTSQGGSAASSGGSSAAAGGTAAASSGGTDVAPSDGGEASVAPTGPSMVDDFEDGNPYIIEQDDRNGAWYVSNDGRANQTPRPGTAVLPVMLQPARGESRRGLHTTGGPFPEWGALIGTSLVLNGATSAPYDLSGYTGIAGWVRAGSGSSSGPGSGPVATSVRLNLPSTQTNTGGACSSSCNDHFGFEVPLSSEWQRFELPFSELAQSGFGTAAPSPDLEHVTAIQFFFPQDVRFDLWIDDIELY
jgi:hypothetical protein